MTSGVNRISNITSLSSHVCIVMVPSFLINKSLSCECSIVLCVHFSLIGGNAFVFFPLLAFSCFDCIVTAVCAIFAWVSLIKIKMIW